jgi:cholesterol transport system auxiliary component
MEPNTGATVMRRITFITLTVIVLAACAPSRREATSIRYFDFGPQPVQNLPKVPTVLQVANVSAPEWLETTGISYRLAYEDPQAVYIYTSSRWVAPPNTLLTNRLNAVLAEGSGALSPTDAIRTGCVLRIAIEDFTQTFDTPQSSHGTARARASLSSNDSRQLIAQKSFVSTHTAPSDINGAVMALGQSGDALVADVVHWLAAIFDADTAEGRAAIKQCKGA